MIIFAIVFYVVGLLLLICGVAIFRGKTWLIHDYHRANVTDHENYGKAMGKAIGGMGLSACLSATLSFLGEAYVWLCMGAFLVGFVAMFILIIIAQRKYNGGMFS